MLLGNKVMTEEMNHKKNVNYLLIFLLFRPTSILGYENMFDSNHIPAE